MLYISLAQFFVFDSCGVLGYKEEFSFFESESPPRKGLDLNSSYERKRSVMIELLYKVAMILHEIIRILIDIHKLWH